MRWQDLISSLYVCVCSAETHLSWLAFWLTSSTPVNNLKNREALDIWSVKPSLVDIFKPQWKQMSIYLGRFCCKTLEMPWEGVLKDRSTHKHTHHLSLFNNHNRAEALEVLSRPAVEGRGELAGMRLTQEMSLELETKINTSVLLISKVENKVENEEGGRLEEKWSI